MQTYFTYFLYSISACFKRAVENWLEIQYINREHCSAQLCIERSLLCIERSLLCIERSLLSEQNYRFRDLVHL